MRKVLFGLALFAPLAFAPLSAQAQTQDSDRVASTAIAKGDMAGAERVLLQELRIHPNRPELLLNLAAVYVKTGRAGQARGLYQRVLAQDDVLMDLKGEQVAGSHALATVALRRIDLSVATASR